MELDNLKYVWKRLESDPSSRENSGQILDLLAKKPQDPVSRMKRNLRIEFVLSILLYIPLSIWYLFDFNGKLPEVSVFLFLVLLLFLFYYYRKYRLLNEMQNLSYPVKENLKRQITRLENYLKFYLITGVLIPVCILLLGVLMYGKLPNPAGPALFYVDRNHPLWALVLLWIGIFLFASLFIYFADRWYVNKLYIAHIRKLKEILKDLEE